MTIISIGNKLLIDYTEEEQKGIDKFLIELQCKKEAEMYEQMRQR